MFSIENSDSCSDLKWEKPSINRRFFQASLLLRSIFTTLINFLQLFKTISINWNEKQIRIPKYLGRCTRPCRKIYVDIREFDFILFRLCPTVSLASLNPMPLFPSLSAPSSSCPYSFVGCCGMLCNTSSSNCRARCR